MPLFGLLTAIGVVCFTIGYVTGLLAASAPSQAWKDEADAN